MLIGKKETKSKAGASEALRRFLQGDITAEQYLAEVGREAEEIARRDVQMRAKKAAAAA